MGIWHREFILSGYLISNFVKSDAKAARHHVDSNRIDFFHQRATGYVKLSSVLMLSRP